MVQHKWVKESISLFSVSALYISPGMLEAIPAVTRWEAGIELGYVISPPHMPFTHILGQFSLQTTFCSCFWSVGGSRLPDNVAPLYCTKKNIKTIDLDFLTWDMCSRPSHELPPEEKPLFLWAMAVLVTELVAPLQGQPLYHKMHSVPQG